MSPLELAAKASYEASGDAGVRMPPWEKIPADHPFRVNRLRDTRAAMEALLTPSSAMVERGIEADGKFFGGRTPVFHIWRAMLEKRRMGWKSYAYWGLCALFLLVAK